MEKRGYSKILIDFIKKIYQNTESVIPNNGFLGNPSLLSRGVRKGCPMFILLYIINGVAISLSIKPNEKIVGYPMPNEKEKLKLSQYADDTKYFVVTEESIIQTLNFFKKYEIATGATINISETKVTPLANVKIYNLDQKTKKHTNN